MPHTPARDILATALFLLAAVWGAGLCGRAAQAAEPAPVMIILDGSGSMWGRLEGEKSRQSKLDLARDALRAALAKVPANAVTGLMSFGHRRGGDCNDIEVIAPLAAAGDTGRLLTPLDKLNPRGKGPITEALRQAAVALGKTGPATIVLIHDNADNCRADTCEAATAAAAANPGLKIHVVSLGVDEDEMTRIRCIPTATNGRLFNARTAAEVGSFITEAMALAMAGDGAPAASAAAAATGKAAPAPQPIAAAPTLVLQAKLATNAAALGRPVHWRVLKEAGRQPLVDQEAPTLTLPLEPGRYTVEASAGFASTTGQVDVAEKGETRFDAILEAAALRITVRDAQQSAPLATAVVTLKNAADPSARPLWIGRAQEADFILPAGRYGLRVADSLAEQEEQVTLAAGNALSKDVMLGAGRLELWASDDADGKPLDGATFFIAKDDPDQPGGKREIARSTASRPVFLLPAGTYYVTARVGAMEARQRVGIGAGDNLKRPVAFNIGKLNVTADIPALRKDQAALARTPVVIRVLSLDGEPHEVARANGTAAEFQLAGGRYRVEAGIGPSGPRAVQDVTVDQGDKQRAALKLDASPVTLKLGAGQVAPDTVWEVREATGGLLVRAPAQSLALALPAGRYVARVDVKDRRTERRLDVTADGQPRIIEFALP